MLLFCTYSYTYWYAYLLGCVTYLQCMESKSYFESESIRLGVLVRYAPLEDVLVTYTPILHGYKYLHTHNKVVGWDTGPTD